MQLITRYDVEDYDAFRAALDDDMENVRSAGLKVLQIWRDADRAGRVWLLFEVADRDKAKGLVTGARGTLLSEKGGVQDHAHHFVNTA